MTAPRTAAAGLDMLSKADAVLEALCAQPGLSVSEIAQRVGEPVSSTYRLVRSLTATGWIDPAAARGRYRLGLGFIRIGSLVEDQLDVRRTAQPGMRRLSESSGMSSYLVVMRGQRAVCIEKCDGTEIRLRETRVGDALPFVHEASSAVLLAHLPESELDVLAAEHPEAVVVDAAARRAWASSVRRRGYAEAESTVPGVSSIAVPVFNRRGEVEAALALCGLTSHLKNDREELLAALLASAEASSRGIGGRGNLRRE